MKQDWELQGAVADELRRDASIDPSRIGVTASNGVVTLTGRVNTNEEKRAVERAAERVKEAKAVVNELKVGLGSGPAPTDEWHARRALQVLADDPAIPEDCITLTVEDGWMTLGGTVDWEYQKVAADDDVHSVPGVRGVTNRITIRAHEVVGG